MYLRTTRKFLSCLGLYVWNSVFFSISAFTVVVYMGLSVGCTLTWSLYNVFTRYLSFATVLSNAISGCMFVTPDMKIGGGFGSALCLFPPFDRLRAK